jgi:hypothetical protein
MSQSKLDSINNKIQSTYRECVARHTASIAKCMLLANKYSNEHSHYYWEQKNKEVGDCIDRMTDEYQQCEVHVRDNYVPLVHEIVR